MQTEVISINNTKKHIIMQQTNVFYGRVAAVIAAITMVVISCKKETLPIPTGETSVDNQYLKNPGKPGAYIKASEHLTIPVSVAVPEGSIRVATYYAEGFQRYKAQEVAGLPGVYQWVFVAPQANLYQHNGKLVGTHAAGPHWTLFTGDSIFAQHFVPARTAPAADAASIDWLLLKPKAGTTPTGIFTDVAFIQRIATEGGKAPTLPPLSITDSVNVAYKAVYRFSK
jgi:hypothetical protein